jgi:beta-hydroxylase
MRSDKQINQVGQKGRLYITRRIWLPQYPLQQANLWLADRINHHMPKLPLVGNEALERFPELSLLPHSHEAIKEELLQLLEKKEHIPDLYQVHPRDKSIYSPQWRIYILKLWGYEIATNISRCPETMKVVARIPGVHTALFSILDPHSGIPPHEGWAAGVVRCHYPLITPEKREDCFMEVAGHRLCWQEREPLLFDDTRTHSVKNNTSQMRVVLIVDFEPPMPLPLRAFTKLRYHLVRNSEEIRHMCENAAVTQPS